MLKWRCQPELGILIRRLMAREDDIDGRFPINAFDVGDEACQTNTIAQSGWKAPASGPQHTVADTKRDDAPVCCAEGCLLHGVASVVMVASVVSDDDIECAFHRTARQNGVCRRRKWTIQGEGIGAEIQRCKR